ncbi:MAG: CpaF family protein [Nitrospirae bacterium]|nr:CpaF family protein [Nitrospirota bacterium]
MNDEASPRVEPSRDISSEYFELKEQIHHDCIEHLNLAAFDKLDEVQKKRELDKIIEQRLKQSRFPMNFRERQRFFDSIYDETIGHGPLEPLLRDHTISDILVNTFKQVYVERQGKLELTSVTFKDNDHLRKIIDRIVLVVGRRIDESSPMVDARLPDGSRVNAIIPPLAIDGPSLSIRKFSRDPLQLDQLISNKSLTPDMGKVLEAAVKARLNILISGGTGSGKTTLLNILSGFIPETERIVTIEDAAELQLRQEHLVRLETRPPNIEGKGEVTQRDLVKNALRMRPDRIVMGEVRGGETLDMLQAMNTGHDGSLTTIHANSPRDSLTRVETLVSLSGLEMPTKALRQYISSALGLIVQQTRLSDGSRKLISMQEITGMEGDIVTLQEIFRFDQTGVDASFRVHGKFVCTGIRPKFFEKCQTMGIPLPPELFDPQKVVEC